MINKLKQPLFLAFISVLVLLIIVSIKKVYSPDIGFHLHAGQWMFENNTIIKTNLFTYPLLGNSYIDLHWLYQLILYVVYHSFSYEGLIILNTVLVLIAIVFLGIRCIDKLDRFYLLPLFILILVFSQTFEIRPHVISWILLSVQMLLLKQFHKGKKNFIYLIFIIQILWINTHSLAILGPIIFAIFFVGNYFETKRINKHLVIVFLGSIACCLINPWNIEGLMFPLKQFGLIQNNSNLQNIYIGEFQSLFSAKNFKEEFTSYGYLFLFAPSFYVYLFNILILTIIPSLFIKKKYTELILVVAFSYINILAVKNFGFQFFALTPIVIAHISIPNFIKKRFQSIQSKKLVFDEIKLKKGIKNYSFALVFICVVFSISVVNGAYYLVSKQPFTFGLGIDKNLLPVEASRFITDNNLNGNCMNFLGFGGQISFETNKLVFADGRLELMGDFFPAYLKSFEPNMFPKICDLYKADVVIFPYVKTGMYGNWWVSILQNKQDWKLVYFDGLSVIYTKRNAYLNVQELTEDIIIKQYIDKQYTEQEMIDIFNQKPKPSYFVGFLNSLFLKEQSQNISNQNKSIFCFTVGYNKAALQFSAKGLNKSTVKSKIIYENLSQYFKEIGNNGMSNKMLKAIK